MIISGGVILTDAFKAQKVSIDLLRVNKKVSKNLKQNCEFSAS